MSFEQITDDYLSELRKHVVGACSTGETTVELSYRPILHRFLHDVARHFAADAHLIFEPKAQGQFGRPDWRIYNVKSLGVYGYVEAKGLDIAGALSGDRHEEQIEKYLCLGHPVILTDGVEFLFYWPQDQSRTRSILLAPKPLDPDASWAASADGHLESELQAFFAAVRPRSCSEDQLIREMALRASGLACCVLRLTDAPLDSGVSEAENRTIAVLKVLQSTLRLDHDPVLASPKVFADFVAQVLCFGLLYAHRTLGASDEEPVTKYNAIGGFWVDAVYSSRSKRLGPIKALVAMLNEELRGASGSMSELRCWYDDALRLLSHVKLTNAQQVEPDYHTLYERFLKDFDPQTRFDFGAFYTPWELAHYSVGLAADIVETEFPGRSLFEAGNRIIDPCCGTGTFLEHLMRRGGANGAAQLVGFEILPAPYALAHYRIANGSDPVFAGWDVEILLTNTLSDRLVEKSDREPQGIMGEELQRARERARPPIVLVIGNPPSSDSFAPHSSGAQFTAIDALLQDFRPHVNERRTRQNTQRQVGNDFMKFLRWSADKALEGDAGVLALILPSTFAAHPSYLHARKWLYENFQQFWVMDIDRDLRTGARSSSLFDVQQGRLLLVAVHKSGMGAESAGRLRYHSIADLTRAKKKAFLQREQGGDERLQQFAMHHLSAGSFEIRPSKRNYDEALYSKFRPLYPAGGAEAGDDAGSVFRRHCSGMKLAPSALFVHSRRAVLQRRSREIGRLSSSYSDIHARWFAGQSKPPDRSKLNESVRARIGAVADMDAAYRPYAFRPHVSMSLLLDEDLLAMVGRQGGGGTRIRPEVVCAFEDAATVGIALAPSPVDIGEELHRFATFCWDLPDNDLCARGNAHVFCNQFPENRPMGRGRDWDRTLRPNIGEEVFRKLNEVRPETTTDDVVFLAYAILCSSVLLNAFGDAYYSASGSDAVPRIPVPSDLGMLERLIGFGRALAVMERPDEVVEAQQWAGELLARFVGEFQLNCFAIDVDAGIIALGTTSNDWEVVLDAIPGDILRLKISGYDVVQCWLKFHSYRYTRTNFDRATFNELVQLLWRLERQAAIIVEVDMDLESVVDGSVALI